MLYEYGRFGMPAGLHVRTLLLRRVHLNAGRLEAVEEDGQGPAHEEGAPEEPRSADRNW